MAEIGQLELGRRRPDRQALGCRWLRVGQRNAVRSQRSLQRVHAQQQRPVALQQPEQEDRTNRHHDSEQRGDDQLRQLDRREPRDPGCGAGPGPSNGHERRHGGQQDVTGEGLRAGGRGVELAEAMAVGRLAAGDAARDCGGEYQHQRKGQCAADSDRRTSDQQRCRAQLDERQAPRQWPRQALADAEIGDRGTGPRGSASLARPASPRTTTSTTGSPAKPRPPLSSRSRRRCCSGTRERPQFPALGRARSCRWLRRWTYSEGSPRSH